MTDTTTADVGLDEATTRALMSARARRALDEAPGLVAYIRTLVVPSTGGSNDGMPRAASKEPPAPMRVDALDESDSIYAQLINWVEFWSEQLTVRPPATATVAWRNAVEVQGFRPTTTPPGAGQLVGYLTTWLLIRHDDINRHTSGGAYFDDIASIIWQGRARYPRAPRGTRQVMARPCPVCDHYAFGADWQSEEPADFVLRCEHCGHEEPAKEHLTQKRVRELIRDLREEHAAGAAPEEGDR